MTDAVRPLAEPRAPIARPAWRARLRAWWHERLPLRDALTLTQRNIYIVPTRAGLMFGLTLLVLLLASINYQLNLGYVLTFLLAGSGLASMHITHGTLRALHLHLRPVAPAFAGEAARIEVVIDNPGHARHGIGLRTDDTAAHTHWVWTDVPAGGHSVAHLSFVPARRGRHRLPTLIAETRFPLGLFRAWTVWRPATTLLVYPSPERPAPPLPPGRAVPGGPTRQAAADGGEIEGIRAYRRGDPLKHIVWKKAARAMATGGELVSRDTRASTQLELWLDAQHCAAGGIEACLSRLTAWVLEAERRNIDYGLRLGGHETRPGHGDAQQRACLERLALHP